MPNEWSDDIIMKTNIYIIRHGETDMNKKMALQGRSNTQLNGNGIEQAKAAGECFAADGIVFDKVYSSPLDRAIATAKLAAGLEDEAAELMLDERLLEMDYGPYEGLTLENPPKEILYFFSDFVNHPAPEGMEQLSSVVGRLGEFLEEIKEEAQGAEKNILISTHAIAMKGALEYLTPESKGAYWSKNIGNCAVYKTVYEDGSFSVPCELSF